MSLVGERAARGRAHTREPLGRARSRGLRQRDGQAEVGQDLLDDGPVPRSGHSAQGNRLAIEEVRRILVEHAEQACRLDGVACAPPAAAGRAPAVPPAP